MFGVDAGIIVFFEFFVFFVFFLLNFSQSYLREPFRNSQCLPMKKIFTKKDKKDKKVSVSQVMVKNKAEIFTIWQDQGKAKRPKVVPSVALQDHQDDDGMERAHAFILKMAKQYAN